MKLVGTTCLVLKDDAGKTWLYDIPDVVYDPELPYSLLGIPFLGKYFDRNDEANKFNKQTWIQSALTSSPFQWDHGKHQRHFKHGNTYLPESLTNEGETYFAAFCTLCISKFVNDKINYAFSLAFTTSPDGIPQPHVIPNDDDDEIDKYSGTHLHMCVRMNSQINVFVSANQQNLPNLFCMKLLKLCSS